MSRTQHRHLHGTCTRACVCFFFFFFLVCCWTTLYVLQNILHCVITFMRHSVNPAVPFCSHTLPVGTRVKYCLPSKRLNIQCFNVSSKNIFFPGIIKRIYDILRPLCVICISQTVAKSNFKSIPNYLETWIAGCLGIHSFLSDSFCVWDNFFVTYPL